MPCAHFHRICSGVVGYCRQCTGWCAARPLVIPEVLGRSLVSRSGGRYVPLGEEKPSQAAQHKVPGTLTHSDALGARANTHHTCLRRSAFGRRRETARTKPMHAVTSAAPSPSWDHALGVIGLLARSLSLADSLPGHASDKIAICRFMTLCVGGARRSYAAWRVCFRVG